MSAGHRSATTAKHGTGVDRAGFDETIIDETTIDGASVDDMLLGASALSASGALEEAEDLLRSVLAREPLELRAWAELARLPDFVPDPESLAALATIEVPPGDDTTRAMWALTIATMYDRLDRVDDAWPWFEEMNAALRSLRPYDPTADQRFLADVREHVDEQYFSTRRGIVSTTARPIFVFGLPRSGTTLVEQILASHPDVRAGGELDTAFRTALSVYRGGSRTGSYVRELPGLEQSQWDELARSADSEYLALAGDLPRVTDKMPSNDHHIALLAVLFPDASFVRIHRSPLDVCVSNYKLMYASRNAQANDVVGLADSWAVHQELMDHWRSTAPTSILDVEYERLVTDQEGETERLLAHCELEWSDACLRFHERPGMVMTASRFQVRQPMYASSIGAWRRYSSHLELMRRELERVGAIER